MKVEVMKRNKSYAILLGVVALNLLNLFDAYFTYIGVSHGYLEELNPVMDYPLHLGPIHFFTWKIALVGLASSFLYIRRSNKLARRVTWFGCILYFGIAILHCFHLFSLSNLS